MKSICLLGYEKAEGKKCPKCKKKLFFMKQYIKFVTDDGFIVN